MQIIWPLWGCMTLEKSSAPGFFFGHDKPIVPTLPDGVNFVYTDGSGVWSYWKDMEAYLLISRGTWYWPIPKGN